MSRMLAALKRLEGRRPPKVAERPRVAPTPVCETVWEDVADKSEDPTELELSEAALPSPDLETTQLTIEPTSVVTACEVVRGEFVDLPSDILEQVEELTREVAQFQRGSSSPSQEKSQPEAQEAESRDQDPATLKPHLGPYRLLRDRILSERPGNGPAMFLFTSPDAESLKAFSLWHLAEVFGEQNAGEVLMVDTDPEHLLELPLGIEPLDVGLDDALQGKHTWADIVQKTPIRRVNLITQGHTAARIESSEVSLWDELRQQFRVVLVHAGPANSAATLWLAPLCDVTYLVISLNRTQRYDALKSQTALRACGANLAGTIVTGCPGGG